MAQLNFNANEVAPDTGSGDPVPEGWYTVQIDESDIKPTKDNASTGGAFLQVRFSVMGGQHNGRKLFSRFNIRNANPVAQEIGYKQLSAVAHAVGVLMVQDSQQLHGIPLKVRVKVRAGQQKKDMGGNPIPGDFYEASNEISAYRNVNDPTAVSAPSAATIQQGFGAAPAAPAAPQGFGGFGAAPAPQAPAAPNPAQWAAPAGQQFAAPQAPAAPQFAQPAQAPQFAAPPVPQFAQPAPAAPAAPAFQGYQQPEQAPQQFQPQQQAAPVQGFQPPPVDQGQPAFQPPQFQQQFTPPQQAQQAPQFAQPAQAPQAPQQPTNPAVAAQGSAPPWARKAE